MFRLRRPAGLDRIPARALLLNAACDEIVERGAVTWTLDDQDDTQRARDRRTIGHALDHFDQVRRPVYDHQPGHAEPLLWAADAVCWAVGAGRDWRRRVSGLVKVVDLSP